MMTSFSEIPCQRKDQTFEDENKDKKKIQLNIVWFNVLLYVYFHLFAIYGLYLCFTSVKLKTILFSCFYLILGNLGITAGSHRLWSHRSYKAKWLLRALLCAFASIAGQEHRRAETAIIVILIFGTLGLVPNSFGHPEYLFTRTASGRLPNDIFEWCRDHRVHHKFSETEADPHNIKRGFFFAHMGWLFCKKHPDVLQKGKTLNFEDLLTDPIVRFQRKYYWPMMTFFCLFLPTIISKWCWGESWWNAFLVAGVTRYCLSLHITWLVNSAAHCVGNKPFDKYIEGRENPFVSFFAVGEGWHNYHHVYPWDYAASELGYTLNLTKMFIDFMALIGLAYDLKSVDPEMVKKRKLKSGDGSRQ